MSKPKSAANAPRALDTPTDLSANAIGDISGALNAILADSFALYLKTKNFHWHMSGPHFRDYHLMFDEQADAIFATTDELAERVRKIGGTTVRSIGHIAKLQTIEDNDADFVDPADMLKRADGRQQEGRSGHAQGAQGLRRSRRCREREPARKLHRRHRTAHLVPVRSGAQGGWQRPLRLCAARVNDPAGEGALIVWGALPLDRT